MGLSEGKTVSPLRFEFPHAGLCLPSDCVSLEGSTVSRLRFGFPEGALTPLTPQAQGCVWSEWVP